MSKLPRLAVDVPDEWFSLEPVVARRPIRKARHRRYFRRYHPLIRPRFANLRRS